MRENFSSAYQSLSFDMWQVKTKLTPHFYIALLRMMIGLIFLTVAYSNWENGYYSEEGLQRFFTEVFPQSQNPFGWYAQFVNTTILPLASQFSKILAFSEVLLGVALLAGFLTPLISVGAMFFILNTFLATFGQDWPWSYITWIQLPSATGCWKNT